MSYYQYDGGGNVRQLTNSTGQVTDSYEYDAFGNSFTKQGTTPNNYLYRGEQYDPDLGLYYLRARYYNPATGRFMSRDLLAGLAQWPASLHKYLYASGNPANRIDPRGLSDAVQTGLTDVRMAHLAETFAHAMECGNAIGMSLVTGALFEDYKTDPMNATVAGGFLSYGCLQMVLGPEGGAFAWVDAGIRVAGCADSLYVAVKKEDIWLKDQTEDNLVAFEQSFEGGLFGCVLTIAAAGLGQE